ncbi:MAG: choice-of-anchor Q domain-containing protein [Candidatus Cloacimonadaceae bacterium]|jgi:predicted outer membrane repeat protein
MKMNKYIIMLFLLSLSCLLMADPTRDPWLVSLDNEFLDSEMTFAPIAAWESAGSNAIIDSVFFIDVSDIPDDVTYEFEGVDTPIPEAQSGEGFDNSLTFNELIKWINSNVDSVLVHTQIIIPPGIYNFSDQIIMHTNISLKGAGSDLTELRFLIQSDPTSGTMTQDDCRKDAIRINGSDDAPLSNVGIEDLKIVRIREFLSEGEIWSYVKVRVGDPKEYAGNNIAIRFANNCWVKGVASEKPFRNHVTMQSAHHVTVSGVYFHLANHYRGGGFGYGVGLWDSSNNLISNSIFDHLRHGVTVVDGSKYNVISYNYFLNQYSSEFNEDFPGWTQWALPTDVNTTPRGDIAIHGEAENHWFHENPDTLYTDDPSKRPMNNLIEGNCLRNLEVDGTHEYNGSHNTFLRNRVKGQIHVHGRDGYTDSFLTWAQAWFVGWSLWDFPYVLSLFPVHYLVSKTCVDCTALKFDKGDYFKNQPRQLFVNNYARERHWWRSQIQDYPVRLHSQTSQFQANTLKDYATWWGGVKKVTTDRDSDFDGATSFYNFDSGTQAKPYFWPDMITWPYNYKRDENPAQQRFHFGDKYTVGSDDNTSFVSIHHITADTLLVEDLVINPGRLMLVEPGVTISISNGKRIKIHGSLIANGTEAEPITFTSSDSLSTWRGIEVTQKDNKPLPSISLNNCNISRTNKRALFLESYSEAHIDSCRFVNNQDHGAISSRDGSLYLSNSLFSGNSIYSNSQKNGAALFLENTDAHVSNTIFAGNVSKSSITGTVHVKRMVGDENRKIEFFNCYFSSNTFDTNTSNENIGLAIYSQDYEGALDICNCSFINQPQEIFSTLNNDVFITNGLFWNSSSAPHFIKSNQTNPLFSFMVSKSFIPDYTQSPNINNYTVLDTVYTGNAMLHLDTESNLYSPQELSFLVNAGNNGVQGLESYIATDLLGNPRYCGSGIDIGAIEVMKPEVSIADSLVDFGDVPVFEEQVLVYRVENIGTEDLILDNPNFPEGYSTDISFPYIIRTAYIGSTDLIEIDEDDDEEEPDTNPFVDIPIKFSPLYHAFDYETKLVTLATNDSLCSLIQINVTGIGTAAELSISADSLHMIDFPANNTPSFGREFLILKNTGNIGLVVDSLNVSHSENGFASFQYATATDTLENKQNSMGLRQSKETPIRAKSSVRSQSDQTHSRSSLQQQRSKIPKRDSIEMPKVFTWHGAGYNHQIQLAPGDSIFVYARYKPFLIGADSTHISIRCNDAYNPERAISLFGQGIPLVVTDTPTETQVSNIVLADTLWSCPQIEVKSSVQVSPQARLTIRPYKDAVSVQSDSTCGFNVSGELHARRSLNQLYGVSFAGVDSLASWKGFVFESNLTGESRLDSLTIINTNDYSRFEEGGGAIHSNDYHSILLNNVDIESSHSQHKGGAIYLNNGMVQLSECSITNGTALKGGAISAIGSGSNLSINGSTFSSNQAQQSGGFLFAEDANISVYATQIAENSAAEGGAISVIGSEAELSMYETTFSSNAAQEIGGAVYLDSANASLMESTFIGNESIYGGAIAIVGDQSNVAISQGVFNDNGDSPETANYSCNGGSIYHAGGQLTIHDGTSFNLNRGLSGGAIALAGATASLSVENVSFNQNTASSKGGAISSAAGSVVVQNSTFENCSASEFGGAIAMFDSDYILSRNQFVDCRADSLSGKGGSIYIQSDSAKSGKGQAKQPVTVKVLNANEIKLSRAHAGGAVYQQGEGDITSNAILKNTASLGAGMYLKSIVGRFENNTIADNIATDIGWALVCDSLAVTIVNTIIYSDSLTLGSPIHCINAQSIDLVNCAIEDTLNVVSGTFASVSTINCITEDPSFDTAGPVPYQLSKTSLCVNTGTRDSALEGVDVIGNPRINVNNGTPIIDIGAYEYMGPYWEFTRDIIPDYVEITYSPTHFINDLEVTSTGTLHIDPSVSFLASNNSMIKVLGSIDAQGTDTSRITFSTAPGNNSWYGFSFEGGLSAGSSRFLHCSFSNGKAYSDLTPIDHDAVNGGVMYINGYLALQIDYCSFSGNQASDSGGAIYVTNFSPHDTLFVANSSFTGNKVREGTGGAICAMDTNLHLQDNHFSLNTAGYPLDASVSSGMHGFSGGALSLIKSGTYDTEHTVVDNQFLANLAAGTGGSIYASAGMHRIFGNQFIDSIALGADKSGIIAVAHGGGAIGIVDRAEAEINQNMFDSNYAYAGGAILNNESMSNIADNTFTGNKAKYGGAIQLINLATESNLLRNVFTANGTADSTNCEVGGAIRMHNCAANTNISLSKFTDNSSTSKGGAVAIQNSGRQIVVNNQISNNFAAHGGGVYLEDAEVELSNNTIAHNEGIDSGGGVFLDHSRLESTNNLQWSNSSPNGFEVYMINGASMPVLTSFISQTPNALVCLTGSSASFDDCYGDAGESPLMINDMHNYNLKPDSPCVNSGYDNVYHTSTDLNNRSRIIGGRIDIGAYEYSGTTISIDPVDSLTIWDDACITVSSPITLSNGKVLIIEDNVSVFFEPNGSLYVENSTLETRNNISFVSENSGAAYHVKLKDASSLSFHDSSALGVKLQTEGTYLSIENSMFVNSLLAHKNQSLDVMNTEFSASTLDAVNTVVGNDDMMVSIVDSYFHDQPDSTAIRIYSFPNFKITDNLISNYYTGLSLFESGHGKFFSLQGNIIEGNQYGYGIQVYHSNVEMDSHGSVRNNYIGLGGLRNSSIYLAGNKEPPYQSFSNNYFDEMAFTHDSFPKDIRFNLIYDSLRPTDVLLRCTGCSESATHDVSFNYWNMVDPHNLLVPSSLFSYEPVWEMEAGMIPEVSADQDLFELARYNLRIGHNDLAVIHFKDLIENYPDTKYKEEAAKLLMAAGSSSSAAIYDLQRFYATEPNLHNDIGSAKLADYLVNYCNLKLEDYQSVIEWYEDIISNPPSVADSIYAVIDLAYTHLLMSEANTRNQYVGKYSQYIPESMQTFRRDLDGYINLLLQPTPTEFSTPPVPKSFVLRQNYPNPFNPTTTIAFEIPEDAPAQLAIYNIRGQLVKHMRYELLPQGYHRMVWDGRDTNGRSVGSGIYFYRMTYKGKSLTKKMCIVK